MDEDYDPQYNIYIYTEYIKSLKNTKSLHYKFEQNVKSHV